MFAFISQNWRGKPLLTHNVIVQLIAATKTTAGLAVACDIDTAQYPKGVSISQAQLKALNIRYDPFHPDWNYTILPTSRRRFKATAK